MEHKEKYSCKNNKKVAIVGSGPAGMTCAGEPSKKGYDVTVFEASRQTGWALSYGIPEFRLPKELVQKKLMVFAALGVKVITKCCGRKINYN